MSMTETPPHILSARVLLDSFGYSQCERASVKGVIVKRYGKHDAHCKVSSIITSPRVNYGEVGGYLVSP